MTVFSDSGLLIENSGNLPPPFFFFLTRFLTGPLNLNDPEAKFRFPKIFVSAEDGYEELHLIVYKVQEHTWPAIAHQLKGLIHPLVYAHQEVYFFNRDEGL